MTNHRSVDEMLDQTEVIFGDTAILKNPEQQGFKAPSRKPACIRFVLDDGTKLDALARPLITIGRKDKRNAESVDIDFAHLGGRDKGISRHHAIVSVGISSVYLKDCNSSNGTILNGDALYPMREYVIKDGDTVMLGKIEATVKFIY